MNKTKKPLRYWFTSSNTELSTIVKQFKISVGYLILMFTLLSHTSCSEDPPLPEPKDSYVLKFKTTQTIELQQQLADNAIQNIPIENINQYFGKRAQLNTPSELQFTKDSLCIVISNQISETYKIEWKEDELHIFDEQLNKLKYCGKKEADSFTLNTGFYVQKYKNNNRSLTCIGQAYTLQSFAAITDYSTSEEKPQATTWLKMEYSFE
jgi:hypothetical protein